MTDPIETYRIIPPPIPSAGIYFFTTDNGIEYEVRFGRRQDNILHATIVFGVINEEYEGEEYVVTNKGDVYRVMSTISKIIGLFMTEHPKIYFYEFTGLSKDDEDEGKTSKRNLLYMKYLPRIFGAEWEYKFVGNSVLVSRKAKIIS